MTEKTQVRLPPCVPDEVIQDGIEWKDVIGKQQAPLKNSEAEIEKFAKFVTTKRRV